MARAGVVPRAPDMAIGMELWIRRKVYPLCHVVRPHRTDQPRGAIERTMIELAVASDEPSIDPRTLTAEQPGLAPSGVASNR